MVIRRRLYGPALGYLHPQYPTHVCKLHRALYGLKQATCAWFSLINDRLLEFGFVGSRSDSSLFTCCTSQHTTYVLNYVDDILITSSTPHWTTSLLQSLKVDFAVKDHGPLHFFLRMEAISTPNRLILSQQRYILDLLRKRNMSDARPIKSPMSTTHTLSSYPYSLGIRSMTPPYTEVLLVPTNISPSLVRTSHLLSTTFFNLYTDLPLSTFKP